MDPESDPHRDTRPGFYPNGEEITKIPHRKGKLRSADSINTLGGYTEVRPGEYYTDEHDIIEKAVTSGIKARKF